MITQEYLKSILWYDPWSGDFTWISNQGRCKAGELAGSVREDNYVIIRIDYKIYLAHRLAWLYVTGVWPEKEIDHKNLIRCCNTWLNLREANDTQNNYNNEVYRNNQLGLKGVGVKGNKFQARIVINGKRIYLGLFETAELAKEAYDLAARKNHGEFART